MIDPILFRSVLSTYPTGVCVITSSGEAGTSYGMVVGTFTSISLDPPLVGFFPAKTSRSWGAMAANRRFCVNILGVSQLDHIQNFAGRIGDKFAGVAQTASPAGQPILEGVLAWIDCDVERVEDIGDHWLVVGRVNALQSCADTTPLVFFKGHYHDLTRMNPDG